jgi:hypothetical protein
LKQAIIGKNIGRGADMEIQRPLCKRCIYLYTTWDKNFPYGCRAMGIKSAQSPADVVKNASGHDCLAYVEKQKKVNGRHYHKNSCPS